MLIFAVEHPGPRRSHFSGNVLFLRYLGGGLPNSLFFFRTITTEESHPNIHIPDNAVEVNDILQMCHLPDLTVPECLSPHKNGPLTQSFYLHQLTKLSVTENCGELSLNGLIKL